MNTRPIKLKIQRLSVRSGCLPFAVILLLLVSILPGLRSAPMTPVFGPKRYIRSTGAPQTITEKFLHCGTPPCQIVIIDGNADGTKRVSSASIFLNGVRIVGPSDFNKHLAKIVKPIVLADANQITIKLASQPGSFLLVELECLSSPVVLAAGPPGVSLQDPTTLLSALRIMNTGTTAAQNVLVTALTLNSGVFTSPASLPLSLGTIPAGDSVVLNADFTGPNFAPGTTYTLTARGTYAVESSIYCFAITAYLTVPPAAPGSALVHTVLAAPNSVTGAPFPPEAIMGPDEDVNPPGPPVPIGPVRGTLAPTTAAVNIQAAQPSTKAVRRSHPKADATDVVFVQNTTFGTGGGSPNDPSGASGGMGLNGPRVVLTSGNRYGSLSTDGGSPFINLDPTTIFPNRDAAGNLIDGGLCCDQVIHYSPSVNRFFWLMQFWAGPNGANRLRLAAASPEDLINTRP